MADSCVLIPSVRTPKGEAKESILFPGIMSVVGNRDRAVDIYTKVKSPQFQVEFGHLPKDENGELKLASVVSTGIFKDLTDEGVSKKKMVQYGFADENGTIKEKDASIENVRDSYEKADKFNQENDDYIAIPKEVINEKGDRVITVQVERVTAQNFVMKDKINVELGLHNTLVANLKEQGIAVGALDSLEEHLLDNGVTDFTNLTKTTAEGLVEVIRLGKGERGMAALPEEFSHFVIEACTDNVLIDRLVNFVSDENTIKTILGDDFEVYNKKYKGDNQRLAREAAAKLLAIHLTNVFATRTVNDEQRHQANKISSLLNRAWNVIKNTFAKNDVKSLEDIVEESKKLYEKAANKALDKQLSYDIEKASKEKWFNTSTPESQSMERKRNLLLKIIENQTKRYNIAEKRMPEAEEESQAGNINVSGQQTGQTAGYTRRQRELKIRLEEAMAAEAYQAGIYDFLDETYKGVRDALTALDGIESLADGEEKALRLNRARDFIYSYSGILSDIKVELEEDPDYDSAEYKKALSDVNSALLAMTSLKAKYRRVAKGTFEEFVLPYFESREDNPFSDEEMRSLSEILESSPKDISIYDLWLRSAATSSNEVIRLLDHIIKRARERGRQKTIEYRKKLEALGMEARGAGINDFEWMFEKDEDGNKSGNYIQRINYAEYDRRREQKLEELKQKYPDIAKDGAQRASFWLEFRAWEDDNTEEDITGDRVPKYSIYKNTVFEDIMTNPAKAAYKKFYEEFTQIKDELDSLLPLGKTEPLGAIKIRKDMLERIMNGGNIVYEVKEAVKDKFVKRGDDTDVDYEEVVEDFEGRKVNSLPIYYTKLRPGESANDLSTDVISTMIAYAAMANDYYEMNNILQRMELGRDLLLDKEDGHKIGQTKGQKKVEEVLDVLGQKLHKQLTKENTNFEDRLNALYEMNLYSQRRKDEGTVGKTNYDKGKLADELNAITALNTLALNLTAGVTNVVTGTAMLRIEAVAKEFMAYKDVLQGDRAYALAMPAFFAEYGSPVKTNKLSLFDEKFNVMQEYEGQIKNTNFDRKTWFQRMFEMDTLFFMNNCGEHWLQNRTALGLAFAYKMRGPNGEESNLWDALEVVSVNKEHPEYGARLQVKQGYTKMDGSEFTDDDVFEFTRKAAAINQRMHGIYNKEDMNVAQRIGLGRMALLFRKYLFPSIDRRFRKEAIYNYDLGAWEQGYYITAFNFLGKLLSDLKEHKLNIALSWNNLNESQKQNITRALTEVGYFLLIVGVLGLLKAIDKDRKSRSFFLNEFELQLKRQRAEIGTLTPSPMLLNEALKTLKSPAAGIDTLEDMLGVFGVFNPWNWTKEMQSGRFKGHSRAYKLFMTSPFVPLNNTLYKSIHPEELIPFYNQ